MMIEYILITVIYLIGAGFDAMSKVNKVRVKYPDAGFKMVWGTYFKEEWNTLMVTALGLILVLLFWFFAHYRNIPLPAWINDWGYFALQLLCGYALHRLIFISLGTFESVVAKKIQGIKDKP